ncbi:MAG: hypothetical protein COT84_08060 [Chlamydiae bacterium CG10_big_fil_rev_8_21_14_0_10_35_9]|nr:MAG: hypothetical protein COT84_08060 [Chlamydiae bacterium CG10_big_fil_rev_8_21_14_0_10_35_9]
MDKFALFIFNVFLNSLLAFFTTVILIEGVIFLFRIRQGRWCSFLRILPILKLPFDVFYYNFSRWSYAQGINPLMCEEGSRILSITVGYFERSPVITSGIQFTAPGSLTFSVADAISYFFNPKFLIAFSFLLVGCSLTFLLRKIFVYNQFIASLNELQEDKTYKQRRIRNAKINCLFRKKRVSVIRVSNINGSPFVAGIASKVIYMPTSLEQKLTQKEYEAVLAHEVEHIRRKDTFIRFILDVIGSVFWWVPTKWLQKRIEEGQEVACDLKAKRYGVFSVDLASAICKSAKESLHFSNYKMAQYLTKHMMYKRTNILLQSSTKRFQALYFVLSCFAVFFSFLLIFLGRFWIF